MFLTDILIDVLLFCFVVVCALMILIILMQRSKQEGLGTAFAGNFTGQVLGAGASAFLVKTTVILAGLFFILSISLARLYAHKASINPTPSLSPVTQTLLNTPAASTNAPVTTPVVPPAPVTPVPAATAPVPATPAVPAKPATPAKPGSKPQ